MHAAVLSLLLFCLVSFAQAAGLPEDADGAALHVLPAADVAQALETMAAEPDRGPQKIAATVAVDLGHADGLWTVQGSESRWRLRLYSAGASLLIPAFDEFDLPPGAELRAYNRESSVLRGPYTAADRKNGGGLTLPFVPGEEILLEVRMPHPALRDQVRLHLASIAHGVLPLNENGLPMPKSGSCNIDVACQQGGGWGDQIASVVALQIPSSRNAVTLCSGQLVNNSAQNGAPYVLTATHCGVDAGNADDVVAFFNFQTTRCNGSPNGSTNQSIVGSRLLSSDARSDVSLLQLDRAPPASFDAYYSGFNASPVDVPASGASIHHPGGDEKRISVYSQPAMRDRVRIESLRTTDAFRVQWSQGITEPGSSGGGLWNERRQLVGVLSGGNTSCANLRGEDYFGRLDVAWNNGLSRFLDPANTGRTEFCGTSAGGRCASGGGNTGVPPSSGASAQGSGGSGGGAFLGAPTLFALWCMALLLRKVSVRARRARLPDRRH